MNARSHSTNKPDFEQGGQERHLPQQPEFVLLAAHTGASSQQAL